MVDDLELSAYFTVLQGTGFTSAFIPRVDGYYITDIPENLLSRGEFHSDVALMTGTVPDEMTDEYRNYNRF